MNGFTKGTYKIYFQGQESELSGVYKTKEALRGAMLGASPGKYDVALLVGVNDFDDLGRFINDGKGNLAEDPNPEVD